MNVSTWLAFALAVGACGKPEDNSTDSTKGATASKGAPPTRPASSKSASELFTSATPKPPPPLDKLALGMTKAEATAAAPDVLGATGGGYKVPGFEGVIMDAYFMEKAERLYSMTVELLDPVETAKAYLEKKWGAPRATTSSIDAAVYYWDHPASGMRAKLEGRARKSMVTFSRVIDAAQFLGTTKGRFGFEDKLPLFGASKDDVLAAYADRGAIIVGDDAVTIIFGLPPLDSSERPGTVFVKLKNNKVIGYIVNLPLTWDARAKDEILVGMEKLFGKAKQRDPYLDYAGPPKAKVEVSTDQLVTWVADSE